MISKLHYPTTRPYLFHSICAVGCIAGTVAWNSGAFLVALAVTAAPEGLVAARRRLRGRVSSPAYLRQSLGLGGRAHLSP